MEVLPKVFVVQLAAANSNFLWLAINVVSRNRIFQQFRLCMNLNRQYKKFGEF